MVVMSNFEDVQDMLDLRFANVKQENLCQIQSMKLQSSSLYFTRQLVLMKCMTWVMNAASQVLSLHKSGAPAERRIPRTNIFPKWNRVQENTRHLIISFNF